MIGKRARFALRLAALARLDQAQVHPSPGVRDRRLDRPEGLAHRHRLAAARHPRRARQAALSPATWAPASTRARWRRCARQLDGLASDDDAVLREAARRARPLGQADSWWPRSRSANGRATAGSATRSSTACATTSRRAAITREQPVEAEEVREGASKTAAAGAKQPAAKTAGAKEGAAAPRAAKKAGAGDAGSKASASATPTG